MRWSAILGGVLALGLLSPVGCGAGSETLGQDESTQPVWDATLESPGDIPTGEYRAQMWPASGEYTIEGWGVVGPAYDPDSGRVFFGDLTVLDLQSGQILDSFPVDAILGDGTSHEDLVFHPDTGMLIGADYHNGLLHIVDPDTGAVLATAQTGLASGSDPSVPYGFGPAAWDWVVLPDTGLIYAIDYQGSVEVLDPTTAEVVDRAQLELPTPGEPGFWEPWLSVNPATGQVLLRRSVDPTNGDLFSVLVTIDPVRHQITNQIELPRPHGGEGLPRLLDRVQEHGLHPSENLIWTASCLPGVMLDTEWDACGLQVEAYDLSTGEVRRRLALPEHGLRWNSGQVLAVDDTNDRVYVLSAGNVLVLDATTADVVGELADSGTLRPDTGGFNVGLVVDADGDAYLFRPFDFVLPDPDGASHTVLTSVKAYQPPE